MTDQEATQLDASDTDIQYEKYPLSQIWEGAGVASTKEKSIVRAEANLLEFVSKNRLY